MEYDAAFEKIFLETFNIDDIAVAQHLMSPQWIGGPLRLPEAPTIVWQADDGSASLTLFPTATVDVHTDGALTAGQLLTLGAAIRHVHLRIILAVGARAAATVATFIPRDTSS